MTENATGAFVNRAPLSYRFWRLLGFGSKANFDVIDWRSNEEPGFAPGAMVTDTYIRIDFMDRLRLLVSGKARLEVSTKTDVAINRCESRSVFSVLDPAYPIRPQ